MRIGIIGGGLLGSCIAMEFARRGQPCQIIEREKECVTQAGAQNEGKIHLGYIFANDLSMETANLMLSGAAVFEDFMRGWLETDLSALVAKEKFHYLVHRDSLVAPEELGIRYAQIATRAENYFSNGASYFGADPKRAPVRLSASACDRYFDGDNIEAAFETEEVAIDPESLAALIRKRIEDEPLIGVLNGTTVKSVRHNHAGVELSVDTPNGPDTFRFDHAVNASWEDQVALDQTAEIIHDVNLSYRVKYFLRFDDAPQAELKSVSIVLGPFGDIVNYGENGLMLAWYPIGRRGMWATKPPEAWRSLTDPHDDPQFAPGVVNALSKIYPAASEAVQLQTGGPKIRGGLILATGLSDVGDPESRLHARRAIGVNHFGRYHSVNAGKYTTAPLFARQFVNEILDS